MSENFNWVASCGCIALATVFFAFIISITDAKERIRALEVKIERLEEKDFYNRNVR
jgi:hypothetical protein